MPFNSYSYLLFLPAVCLLYCLVGARNRWLALLLASLVFYAAPGEPVLFLALGLVAGTAYLTGLELSRLPLGRRRSLAFWAGVAFLLLVLLGMKYVPFLSHNLNVLLHWTGTELRLAEPGAVASLGVSFFVIQAISYLADMHRGLAPAEKHSGRFALYLCFFPKLTQGPIERAGDLLPQLKSLRLPDPGDVREGLLLLTWGVFKKVVIADRLALFVDPIYGRVHLYAGLPLLFATYLFALQLYADFSGYTDMALGAARLFGVRLTQNFDSPYLARSVADFWRRWHISFSSWLRDYVFLPLVYKTGRALDGRLPRVISEEKLGYAVAALATMALAGLWHGAALHYVAWGLVIAAFMVLSVLTRKPRRRLAKLLYGGRLRGVHDAVKIVTTFNLICLAWIFFRAPSLRDAWYTLTHLFTGGVASLGALQDLRLSAHALTASNGDLVIACASLGIMALAPGLAPRFSRGPWWIRWSAYGALVGWIVLFATERGGAFLYARF